MFTGIVLEEGEILNAETAEEGSVLTISSREILPDLGIGDSISVNGCCLTVVERDDRAFKVEATPETLRLTNLGSCQKGSKVNLEPAARLSDFLGGHLVQGHVDDKGEVRSIVDEGNSKIFRFAASRKVLKYCAYKGSITVNGVSLTISSLGSDYFEVAIIPHTLEVTNFSDFRPGDEVNLEADIISKYVATHVRQFMATALVFLMIGMGQLLGGDLQLGASSVLVYENVTPVKTAQFVVRVARFGPDLVAEWESDKDQGTIHLYSDAMKKAKRFTLSQLFEVGVDNQSADKVTLLLSEWMLNELEEKQRAKIYLNNVQVKMKVVEVSSHAVLIDGMETEIPALRVEDSRKGSWVFARDPKLALVLEYTTPYFSQKLKNLVHPEKSSLRWIKKLPPVQ